MDRVAALAIEQTELLSATAAPAIVPVHRHDAAVDSRLRDVLHVVPAIVLVTFLMAGSVLPEDDGQAAIDYLTAAQDPDRQPEHPLPCLILLDLKLPYRDGFEVLEWIRAQPGLAGMMVVMLTGSGELRDRQRAMALGAHAYLVKPATVDDLRRVVASVETASAEHPSGQGEKATPR